MALFSSLSTPTSLLSSPTPPAFPVSLIPGTAFPRTLVSRAPRVSIGSCRCSTAQPLHSSNTSPDPSPPTGASHPPARIFVKGLSSSTSEGYLARIFSCFGEICRVKIITTRASKQSLGLAYVWFACEEDALLAVKEMDGKFVDGRFVAVMMARPESGSSHVRVASYRF